MPKTENSNKNIKVIDEQGNQYESTYPKRAKGLVKAGRARYFDEQTICLACPPNQINLEETKMNNVENQQPTMDMNYIITKINEIIEMNKTALGNPNLSNLEVYEGTVHPINAICETNNRLIELFHSFIRETANPKETLFKTLNDALETAIEMENLPVIEMIIKELKELTK